MLPSHLYHLISSISSYHFHLILSLPNHFILSHLVSSAFPLISHPIPSSLISSNPIMYHLISSHLISSHHVSCHLSSHPSLLISSHHVSSHLISHSIPSHLTVSVGVFHPQCICEFRVAVRGPVLQEERVLGGGDRRLLRVPAYSGKNKR